MEVAETQVVCPHIVEAIEAAVAASRWRMAAKFENKETARTYRGLADGRRAAVAAALARIGPGRIAQAGPSLTRTGGDARLNQSSARKTD